MTPPTPGPIARFYRSELARQYRYFIPPQASILEIGCGGADLLALLPNRDVAGIDPDPDQIARARARIPHGDFSQQCGETFTLDRTFDFIVISDTLNLASDVQTLLSRLHQVTHPGSRLVINFQNHLWRPLLGLATATGLRSGSLRGNWLSNADVANLAGHSDWEIVRRGAAILSPLPLAGLDRLINRFLAPLLPPLCLSMCVVARPMTRGGAATPRRVSVIVPARNEEGTIEELVHRIPAMGAGTEIVFVEGHSTDGTWRKIVETCTIHGGGRIKGLRQTGSGKANAVREGFAAATGEILMILDADLTTPPEELPKFYDALVSGRIDFANGSRLVYPMEARAMPFSNMCANQAFALGFRWLLGQPIKDTLCGTKALWRADYERIAAQRGYFGDFDPFGDFDLLFGASKLALKIADIPVHYRQRVYGETNIRRWRQGWILLRMATFAAWRMKFVG